MPAGFRRSSIVDLYSGRRVYFNNSEVWWLTANLSQLTAIFRFLDLLEDLIKKLVVIGKRGIVFIPSTSSCARPKH